MKQPNPPHRPSLYSHAQDTALEDQLDPTRVDTITHDTTEAQTVNMNGLYDELTTHHETNGGDMLQIDLILNTSHHTLLAITLEHNDPVPIQVSTSEVRGLKTTNPPRMIEATLLGFDTLHDTIVNPLVNISYALPCSDGISPPAYKLTKVPYNRITSATPPTISF